MKVITHGESGDTTNTVPITGQAPKGIFAVTDNVMSNENGDYANDDFVFGSPSLNYDGDAEHKNRVGFDKSSGTFMAGSSDTQWDMHGNTSAIFGDICSATGNSSMVSGYNCIAGADFSRAFGWRSQTYSNGKSGLAFGTYGYNILLNGLAQGGGGWSLGQDQYARVVIIADTTDATPEILYLSNSPSYPLVIPASTAWAFKLNVVFVNQTATGSKSYEVKGLIRRDNANNTTLDGSTVTALYGSLAVGGIGVSANDTLETLEFTVTGIAGTNIRVVGTLEMTQVSYP